MDIIIYRLVASCIATSAMAEHRDRWHKAVSLGYIIGLAEMCKNPFNSQAVLDYKIDNDLMSAKIEAKFESGKLSSKKSKHVSTSCESNAQRLKKWQLD